MLHVRTAQTRLEDLLHDTILYALKRRLPSVTTVAALRLVETRGSDSSLRNEDDLITVVPAVGDRVAYRWHPASTATDNGTSRIRPADVPASQPGRWHSWSSAVRFAPIVNGNSYTLDQLPYQDSARQPLEQVLVLDKKMTEEEILAHIFVQTPTVVIVADDDDPEDAELDTGFEWNSTFRFTITVVVQNLRDRREAAQGSDVAADPFPGGNTIDGMIWELLAGAGAGRLSEEEDGIQNVLPSSGANEESSLDQRLVLRKREYKIRALLTSPQAPNETGDAEEIAAQAQMTDLGDQEELDLDNLVTSGCSVPLGSGLTKPVAAGTALIDGEEVTYAGELHTFDPDTDTYRDLTPDGAMTFIAVEIDDPTPDLTEGALRVGMTRTDGSGVLADRFLCATKVNYGPAYTTELEE